ncbi:hypothetical protein HYU06_03880 [Candidatus Woesearchaeota archaeon]|nr:hypothetical protein [Candidatus Woesearchaeota archaeon]
MKKLINLAANFVKLHRFDIFAALFFLVLTILMTYPLIFNLSASVAGMGGDSRWAIWQFWWADKALDEGRSFFHSDYLYYPAGKNISFNIDGIINIFAAVFMHKIGFSFYAAYNLILLSTFFLSAFGAYLLAKYITKDQKASIIAGIIFGFSPYHIGQSQGHLALATISFIPYFVLYFLRMKDAASEKNDTSPHQKRPYIKYSILAGIFFALVYFSSGYYLVFSVIFIAIFLVYHLFYDHKHLLSKNYIIGFTVFSTAFLVVASPLLFMSLSNVGDVSVKRDLTASVWFSADSAAFFTPHPFQTMFGSLVSPLYQRFDAENPDKQLSGYYISGTPAEASVFLGYTVIALALLSIYYYRKKFLDRDKLRFWYVLGIIFLVLSLGPVLKFFGIITIPAANLGLDKFFMNFENDLPKQAISLLKTSIGIPLPYLAVYFMPFFSMARTASRFSLFGFLALSIIVSYLLSMVLRNRERIRIFSVNFSKNIFIIIVIALIILEYASIPFSMTQFNVPKYYSALAAQKDEDGKNSFAVMELPYQYKYILDQMFYMTVHEKPIATSFKGRVTSGDENFIRSDEFIAWLIYPNLGQVPDEKMVSSGIQKLKQANIRKIIIHKYPDDMEYYGVVNNLFENIQNQLTKEYEDDELSVYEVW